ncbi:LPXTG-motif cell wall-anchored protein/predicted secreted protein with PEP-CTERM sorting signal, partial [Leucobacter luti]
FVIPLNPIPDDGDKITVEVTDPAGNTSEPTEVVVDSAAPDAPVVDPTNGTKVSGQAEPGAIVIVKDVDGTVLGQGKADKDGNFAFPLSPAAPHGAELSVTATDAAGNVSEPTQVIVDASAPVAPTVHPSNGKQVIGSAEPGAVVKIKDKDGKIIGTGVAGTDGSFVIDLKPFAKTGDLVTATATDAAGNESDPTVVPVNSGIPNSPKVNPTNGAIVSGSAEPNMKITVTDADGNVIGTGLSGTDGKFSITLDRIAVEGETLAVVATNEVGTNSAPTTVTVDTIAPAAPLVNPTDGKTVTGTAEPGSTVTVRDADGNVIGTGIADTDGSFSIVLSVKQQPGAKLSVTATDAAGNESAPTIVIVKKPSVVPPVKPKPENPTPVEQVLAVTGAAVTHPGVIAALFLLLGAGLLVARKRRREADTEVSDTAS